MPLFKASRQFGFETPQLQSNTAKQEPFVEEIKVEEATNTRQKRKGSCSSSVNQGDVKKAKGESTQLKSESVPDLGKLHFYLANS